MHRTRFHAAALSAALLIATSAATATDPADNPGDEARPRTTQELLDASSATDWRRPDPANTLYMELEGGRVVIELAPDFAPRHVANIRTLAKQGFWDGLTIYRSQDNFVVQFGDLTDEGGTPKPLATRSPPCRPSSRARPRACPSTGCPTPMAGRRRPALPRASPPRATPPAARPGWRTATAPSERGAVQPLIQAPARSSTW